MLLVSFLLCNCLDSSGFPWLAAKTPDAPNFLLFRASTTLVGADMGPTLHPSRGHHGNWNGGYSLYKVGFPSYQRPVLTPKKSSSPFGRCQDCMGVNTQGCSSESHQSSLTKSNSLTNITSRASWRWMYHALVHFVFVRVFAFVFVTVIIIVITRLYSMLYLKSLAPLLWGRSLSFSQYRAWL